MPVNPHDPATWPADTIVVRCGSAQGVQELADRLSRDGVWSVYTGPGIPFAELAFLSQQPGQTNDGRGDSEGRRLAATLVRASASP
jgi:hypothetical protein